LYAVIYWLFWPMHALSNFLWPTLTLVLLNDKHKVVGEYNGEPNFSHPI
jgi:hypothetical protein